MRTSARCVARLSRRRRSGERSSLPNGRVRRCTCSTWQRAQAIDALAEARAKRLPIYGETVLAYLSFTQDDLWDDSPVEAGGTIYPSRGALFNNYPTPKFAEDREACWRSIADGRLQAVATDHALVRLQDRFEVMSTTIDNMQAGQAAVELRLPVLYSRGVDTGRISRCRFVELVSTNPAKLMGLWPKKGQLVEGADADIVVFDPESELDRSMAGPAHERGVQLLGWLGAHWQGTRHRAPWSRSRPGR